MLLTGIPDDAAAQISETRAGELQRIVTIVGQHGITSLATLEMHVKLLQVRATFWARAAANA